MQNVTYIYVYIMKDGKCFIYSLTENVIFIYEMKDGKCFICDLIKNVIYVYIVNTIIQQFHYNGFNIHNRLDFLSGVKFRKEWQTA